MSPNTLSTSPAKGHENTELQCDEKATAAIAGKKALVVSLIRHGQSVNQATGSDWPPDGDLSERGEEQAEALGMEWKDVRIDYLYSSTLKRAYRTARAMSYYNKGKPQVIQEEIFVERDIGEDAHEFARIDDTTNVARCVYGENKFDRTYQPPGGGESLNMVAARAHAGLVELVKRHGKDMEAPPDLPGPWGPGLAVKPRNQEPITTSPEMLVDGLPHVVLVAHNVFLTSLYEEMYSWGDQWRETQCDYQNTSWSRHVVWLDIEADKLKFLDLQESNVEPCCIQ